ncbi:hypothetical protein EJ07DRAFT_156697 [Lizonia empirigonia]|nr:hypothetical protein EJ07DRAFT_156697 [Lizonia empirigonia]
MSGNDHHPNDLGGTNNDGRSPDGLTDTTTTQRPTRHRSRVDDRISLASEEALVGSRPDLGVIGDGRRTVSGVSSSILGGLGGLPDMRSSSNPYTPGLSGEWRSTNIPAPPRFSHETQNSPITSDDTTDPRSRLSSVAVIPNLRQSPRAAFPSRDIPFRNAPDSFGRPQQPTWSTPSRSRPHSSRHNVEFSSSRTSPASKFFVNEEQRKWQEHVDEQMKALQSMIEANANNTLRLNSTILEVLEGSSICPCLTNSNCGNNTATAPPPSAEHSTPADTTKSYADAVKTNLMQQLLDNVRSLSHRVELLDGHVRHNRSELTTHYHGLTTRFHSEMETFRTRMDGRAGEASKSIVSAAQDAINETKTAATNAFADMTSTGACPCLLQTTPSRKRKEKATGPPMSDHCLAEPSSPSTHPNPPTPLFTRPDPPPTPLSAPVYHPTLPPHHPHPQPPPHPLPPTPPGSPRRSACSRACTAARRVAWRTTDGVGW